MATATLAPWERAGAKAAATDDVATACLTAVTLAAALGFGRLFSDATFVPYVVAAALLGHGTAWGLRRLGVGLTGASMAAALGSLLLTVWLVSPQDTTYGAVTPSTLEHVSAELSASREVFHAAVAPVAPLPGFLLTITFCAALVAFLADWAAFRMRATFEAVVPAFAIFMVTAIFGTGDYRTASVGALAATSLLFLVVHRAALDAESTTWFGGRRERAMGSLVTVGALIGAVALVGGLVIGPRIPGATSKALVQWRDQGARGGGSRSTISPLVDIRGRLVRPTDAAVFTVRAAKPAYWRLTSLDAFDGNIWSSNEKYRQTKGTLTPSGDLLGAPLNQEVSVSGLSSIWLPGAYRPQRIAGAKDISYSERSASLISRQATSDGVSYQLTSVVPELSPALLRSEPPTAPGASGLGSELETVTSQPRVSRAVTGLVARLTASQRTSYDKAKAIQDFLRTFTYDLRVGAGHSTDALTTFLLTTKRGYCEQFAGAFAVLARLVGLPSRVAVGFQPGRLSGGAYEVRDKDAHAWPEVYFEGVGWVAFEPTPSDGTGSDGNPDAAAYTGVPYTPAAPTGPDPAAATGAESTSGGSSAAATTTIPPPLESATATVKERAVSGALLGLFAGLLAILFVGGGSIGACWGLAEGHRKQRRAAATTPALRIALAWRDAEEALGLARVARLRATTIDEWLERLGRPGESSAMKGGVGRGSQGHLALGRLAATVVSSAYGGSSIPAAAADQAEADRSIVVASAHDAAGGWTVLKWRLDPRPAISAWRSEHRTVARTQTQVAVADNK